jgi:hypothetical protein
MNQMIIGESTMREELLRQSHAEQGIFKGIFEQQIADVSY